MSAFLMQDVDSAKARILQRIHRERAIRPGPDKRPRHRTRRHRVSFVPAAGVSKQDLEMLAAAARGDLVAVQQGLGLVSTPDVQDENNATPLLHAV